MVRSSILTLVAAVAGLMFVGSGCVTTPAGNGYVPTDGEEGIATPALTDHDYDLAVQGIAKELLEQGLPEGFVVALGPVDTKDTKYDVQIRTLQKSLQVALQKSRKVKFTTVVDAIAGNTAAQEIFKIIEYNFWHKNPIDGEELQKIGKFANIQGILFGRVSSIETVGRKTSAITYRFVWELSDTQTGNSLISHEQRIRKKIAATAP